MKKKTLLFYGPYIHHWWLKNIVLPQLHVLSENNWEVYCYVSNKYEAFQIIDNDYLPANPRSNIKFIRTDGNFPVDINQRDYTAEQTATISQSLILDLQGITPDVIVVRGPAAPYLEALFPRVPRLNILEGGFPFLSYQGEDFVLFPGDNPWGLDYFDQHATTLLKRHQLTAQENKKIEEIRTNTLAKVKQPLIEDYVAKLRQRFSKVILFPFEFLWEEADFAQRYYTLKGDQTENLKYLIEKSPKDWCFLVTFHPGDLRFNTYEPQPAVSQAKIKEARAALESHKNVFFPQYDLGVSGITHPLVYSTDASAIQNSKTFTLAMLLEKPIINIGDLCIDFYKPIENFEHLKDQIERFRAPHRKMMNQVFYWIITRFKHPRNELGGSHAYFRSIIERFSDVKVAPGDLYEWGNSALYDHNLSNLAKHIANITKIS